MTRQEVPVRTPHDQLAEEAAAWDRREIDPREWEDAPEAVPRHAESRAISIRLPVAMVDLLRGFAEREGVGYQVLIKHWLDDRLREERDRLLGRASRTVVALSLLAPRPPLVDEEDIHGPHRRVA